MAIKSAKINVATLCRLVHPTRRESEALDKEEMALVRQVTSRALRTRGTGVAARSA